jgi:hypothetical protein
MNDILELLLVATLFICVGCASLWFSFISFSKPPIHDFHNTDPTPDSDHNHTLTAASRLIRTAPNHTGRHKGCIIASPIQHQTMSTPNSSEQRTCPHASTAMHYTNHETTEAPLSQYLELVIRNYHSLQDMGFSHLTMREAKSFLFDDTTNSVLTKIKRTRPTSSYYEPTIPHPRKKQRSKRGKTSYTQTDSLPSTIHPNLQGIITITPPSLWESLHPAL